MTEEELVQKYRLEYQQNQKDYQACVEHFGPRPQLTGNETPEQRKSVGEAQAAWDYFFEHDTFTAAN